MSRLQEQAKNMGVTEDQYREYKLSGLSEDEYKEFFEAIDDMSWDPTAEQTFVLMDLATELKEFLEV